MMRNLSALLVTAILCTGCQTLSASEPATRADPAAGRSVAGVKVDKQEATVTRRTFDPASPPPEMPPLSRNEAAVTHSQFGVGAQVQVVVLKESSAGGRHVSEMRVESLKVDTSLAITVWVPKGARRALVAHEEAHRRISEMFYEDAAKVAQEAARPYVGRTIRGEGRSAEAAREAAMTKAINEINAVYMSKTQAPASRVNELFDEITDHGRNRLSADEGVRRALDRYRQEAAKK